jgi:hypothetical protein
MDNEKFIEVAGKKAIIKKLSDEVKIIEDKLRLTFGEDVKNFFILKGYEFEDRNKKSYYSNTERFKNLRQVNEKNIFTPGYEPVYTIAGKNRLVIRFEWRLKKNSSYTSIYWYPEKQTLDDFYKRRLKKYLILPIVVERKNKLNKIKEDNENG